VGCVFGSVIPLTWVVVPGVHTSVGCEFDLTSQRGLWALIYSQEPAMGSVVPLWALISPKQCVHVLVYLLVRGVGDPEYGSHQAQQGVYREASLYHRTLTNKPDNFSLIFMFTCIDRNPDSSSCAF
jgi:hypothetical protein